MMSDVAKLTAPDTRTTSFMLTLEASSVPAARTDEMHGYPSELGASRRAGWHVRCQRWNKIDQLGVRYVCRSSRA